MKIALYMEDGIEQIVLTPDGTFEKSILGKLRDGTRSLSVVTGSFFECRGGYVRNASGPVEESTILVLRKQDVAE